MRNRNQFALFRSRRFLPLFLTQFLGAFNDNFFKSALVMLITYRLAERGGYDPRILVNIAGGVFILPFFLFSATAGQLADKYERSFLVQIVKIAEILVMGGAALGFYLEHVRLLMVVLFLMGAQSTFFGPLKYSILPQHLDESELISGNGLIQMGTFLSILTGTIFGGLFILRGGGVYLVSVLVVGIAAAGWWASRYIPETRPVFPDRKLSANIVKDTLKIVTDVVPHKDIFLSVLGISWFWLVGATFLAQFPTYARLVIGADEQVATLFLAVFSVGIGLGSMACNSLLKGEVSGRHVPLAAIAMSAASVLLYFASKRPPLAPGVPEMGIWAFFVSWRNTAVLVCLFAISFSGGLYIVPLYAIIQSRTDEARMAGVIACTNVTDSLFIVLSAVGSSLLLALGFSIPQIFLSMAVLTVAAAFFIRSAVRGQLKRRNAL
ncbi:MAG: MFS transporter [Synergistaceae bacterium]|jgi:acyl-[acyl-carrier-protein]-phospholipid O-acyltransferase/long-chain-fatty-acid--[acyl-carrier-protein] ligase|nr:MFS transporter [Synergistaceae bacterium]